MRFNAHSQRRAQATLRENGIFTICLLSKQAQLSELCHEAAWAIGVEGCEVVLLDPDQAHEVAADLLVWDLANTPLPLRRFVPKREHAEQIFLVERKHMQEFLTDLPLGAGSTLLAPVMPRTLQIFVEQAAARWKCRASNAEEREPDSTETYAKDALQCLLIANLKLQEYDQDRTNFIARAVHDFRAPLMAAGGYCSLLLEKALGPMSDKQFELVQRIQHSVEKVTRMAAGMLQLSARMHSQRAPDLREGCLNTCVTNALVEIEQLAAERQITITVDLTDPEVKMYLDSQQMEQVLVNLLENSCKFTPKRGTIEVRGYPEYSPSENRPSESPQGSSSAPIAYRVDVVDSGSGILPEHLDTIFEEYTSYGGSQDRSGGGLGLAICKMIVAAHRGRIWAENTPSGAKLSFVLPVGQLHSRKRMDTAIAARAIAGTVS